LTNRFCIIWNGTPIIYKIKVSVTILIYLGLGKKGGMTENQDIENPTYIQDLTPFPICPFPVSPFL
jgi:hypothetical protein